MTDYPAAWEADVLTADGSVVRIRPSTREDADAIRAMHDRMSARSRYLRYFSAVNDLSAAQLDLYVDVDHVTRSCLLALSGDEVLAAATYHANPADPTSAEVAFVVQDDQQGRGLGSILLEHIAAAARERGIGRFTAEVLTENQAMVRVFRDAGYAVTRQYATGVIDLGFDILPTDESRAVRLAREQRAESQSIYRLLAPRSVAVIGASNDPAKIGHAVFVNLLRSFTGPVYPVNPEAISVQGVRAYATVTDIPDAVDMAVVAVPAAGVEDVMRACRDKGVHGLVVHASGFADAGADGATAQRALVRLARDAGMRVLGPNCLGLANTDPEVRLNATLAPVVPAPGRIGFFCQSGALGIAILADAASRNLGLSSFVSAGNRADVSGNDLLQFWQTDDRTEVVLLYLESFGNARKFARLARRLARSKPVIAVKSGRHALVPAGLSANVSPLSDAAVASLFDQSGLIRTETLSQAFDVALLMANQPLPASRSVAIVGNSTALGVLAFDACLDSGLTVADDAPMDLGAAVGPADLAAAVAEATASGVGAVLVVFVPPVSTDGAAHAEALRAAVRGATVPVLSTFLGVEGIPEHLAVPNDTERAGRGSVPSYRSPERAVAALAAAARYSDWLAAPHGTLVRPEDIDAAGAAAIVDAAVHRDPAPDSDRLSAAELEMILRDYGIGGPTAATRDDEVVAVPAEVGIITDRSFGALVSFGIGGLATELFDDRAYRAVPLTDRDAADLIAAPRAAPLLDGYAGGPRVERAALTELVLRLSALADDLPAIASLQLDVLLGPTGLTVTAAAGTVGPPPSAPDERRRLR